MSYLRLAWGPVVALVLGMLFSVTPTPRALAALAAPVPAGAAPDCRFVLGFAALAEQFPQVVGQCLDDEQHNAVNGDGLQHTTNGLLVWRKSDNIAAFTDGYYTILSGPEGLEERLNRQRFAWEANPGNLPVVGYQPAGPAQFAPRPGPRLRLTQSTLGTVRGPLTFQVAGSGFAAGEAVTLRGTYVPIYALTTSNPQSPYHEVQCATIVLGPVQVRANGTGDFTATVQAPQNLHTGGEVRIIATASQSGAASPVTEVAPEGATVRTVPPGCRDISGVA